MKKWMDWLSYLREIPVDAVSRGETDNLYVTLKKGRLMLSTDKTIYSWDDKYMNYVWGFEKVAWELVQPEKGLLLGMGLGAVPYILEKKFHISIPFTAIEIDPDIVRLAKLHSLNRLRILPEVICSDATMAIHDLQDKYDLIIVDICREDQIPGECESQRFLERIQSLLSEKGVLLYNRFYSTYKDHFRTDRFYKNIFLKTFPHGYLIDQNGTCLLVNDRKKFRKLHHE